MPQEDRARRTAQTKRKTEHEARQPDACAGIRPARRALAKLHIRRVEDFVARFGAKHRVTRKSPPAAIEAAIKAEAF